MISIRFKNFFSFLIITTLLFVFFIPIHVHADADDEDEGSSSILEDVQGPMKKAATAATYEVESAPSLEQTIGSIIKVFLQFLGVIALVLIIYAGFLWMTAGGNEEKVKKAQSIMKAAVIGLIIIVFSGLLTVFIMSWIQGAG